MPKARAQQENLEGCGTVRWPDRTYCLLTALYCISYWGIRALRSSFV